MIHTIKTTNSDELNIEMPFPKKLSNPENSISESSFITGNKTSHAEHRVLQIENISVSWCKGDTSELMTVNLEYDFSCILLEFAISVSNFRVSDNTHNHFTTYTSNQHNILFIPSSNFYHQHDPGQQNEIIRIHIDLNFFKRLIPEKRIFDAFRKKIEMGTLDKLSELNLPISPEMMSILQDIMATQRTGFYKRLMIESKVIELLMLQFEQYENFSLKPFCHTIKKRDIDKMHEVKTIIETNIQTPCSLINLAHLVGTNEYNLKKSFKEVFGTTVFGYLSQLRMEEARQLLLKGEMNINQISEYIGYKNANHFSTAFKKHFGYNPSELKP